MGKNTSNRIIFARKRRNFREYFKLKNIFILVIVILLSLLLFSTISTKVLVAKVSKSTIKPGEVTDSSQEKSEIDDETLPVSNDLIKSNDNINITVLGEIMMGGNVSKNLDYKYSLAVKDIYNITNKADFTYANFSTNITNLDKIQDAKSEYLVTKDVVNALGALGVDALSIANDHITDFPSDIIKNTISILQDNDIFVAGRKDMPLYLEKNNKKIAIISTNCVIIGTSDNYTKNDISIYSEANLKKNIKEAKQMADFVIVDFHWGKGESSFGISSQMVDMAHIAIDNGADLVMGTHAIGIQPIEMYNNKPIIYSTGYLITPLEYETTKLNYILSFNFSNDVNLKSIEMTPIYINNSKEVLQLYNYNSYISLTTINNMNSRIRDNGFNTKIDNNKIIIEF